MNVQKVATDVAGAGAGVAGGCNLELNRVAGLDVETDCMGGGISLEIEGSIGNESGDHNKLEYIFFRSYYSPRGADHHFVESAGG
jgi:hypothetical protein